MSPSNKTIVAIALAPVALYMAAMMALLLLRIPIPTSALGGGAFVVFLSVGFANILRLRRDRKGPRS